VSKKLTSEATKIRSYRKVFGTREGQHVLHDLMSCCHMLHPSFVKDPYEAAFREGERNAVLRILTLINEDPAKLEARIKALEESRKEDEEYA